MLRFAGLLALAALCLVAFCGCWTDNIGPKNRPADPYGLNSRTNSALPPLPPRAVQREVQRDLVAPPANVARAVRLSWDRRGNEWFDLLESSVLPPVWSLRANLSTNLIDLPATEAQKFFTVKAQNEFGDSL